MSKLSVSLVMPNYNHEAFLERAVLALFQQTIAADEIIIIDDASTDGSVATIERLIAGRSNVVFLRNANRQGAIGALNMGLERARGDLIAFPSADDLLFPDFIERLERVLRENKAAAFACASVELRDGDDRVTGHRPILWPAVEPRYIPPAEARRQLERGDNFFLGSVTIYRRATLIAAGGFDGALSSLADGMLQRQLAVTHGFCFEPKTLGIWRHHASNYSISSVTEPDTLDAMLEGARRRIGSTREGQFPANYAATFDRRLRFNASRLVVLGNLPPAEKASCIGRLAHLLPFEATALAPLLRLGAAGRILVIAWLTLRLRPYSLTWLVTEPLRRQWARYRKGRTKKEEGDDRRRGG